MKTASNSSMKRVYRLLRKELKSWKQEHRSLELFFAHDMQNAVAKRLFSNCEKNISELEQATEKLFPNAKI